MRNFEKKVVVVENIDVDGWKKLKGIRKTRGELKIILGRDTKK